MVREKPRPGATFTFQRLWSCPVFRPRGQRTGTFSTGRKLEHYCGPVTHRNLSIIGPFEMRLMRCLLNPISIGNRKEVKVVRITNGALRDLDHECLVHFTRTNILARNSEFICDRFRSTQTEAQSLSCMYSLRKRVPKRRVRGQSPYFRSISVSKLRA